MKVNRTANLKKYLFIIVFFQVECDKTISKCTSKSLNLIMEDMEVIEMDALCWMDK